MVFNVTLGIPQHALLLLGAIEVTVTIRRILWDWQCVSVQVGSQLQSALPSYFAIKAHIKVFEWRVINISSMTLVQQCSQH